MKTVSNTYSMEWINKNYMTLKDRVRLILESWPASRDDEGLLIASVWSNELDEKRINVSKQRTFEFMSMVMEGTLSSASSILATRIQLEKEMLEARLENIADG